MTKTLQKKFTVTAMIAVTLLLVLLLGAINLVNQLSASRESDALLEMLAAQEGFGPAPRMEHPDGEDEGLFRRRPDENDRMTALTFSVRFSAEGEAEAVNLDRIADLSEEEAVALGQQALASGKNAGRLGTKKYRLVQAAPGGCTAVFLDVSRQRHELLRLAALSALGGAGAWLAMLALVSLLSRRAIRPIAENMERQRRFVTDAGHELKTPLAIIQANAEALELLGGESKYSRNIRAQTARLTELTKNLLTLARFDEAATPVLSELDFSALVREAMDSFRTPAERKGLRLTSELEENLSVRGDREQLRQLCSILLDNAVKYCPEGGALSVTLGRKEGAVLRVANTAADQSADPTRLFDRFYRADDSRSRDTGGFGIGLSAAQAIVRLHRGEISAAYEGDALVFTVRLP